MEVGILAKTYRRDHVEEVIRAAQNHKINTIQYNLSCANLPTLPLQIEHRTLQHLQNIINGTGVKVAALSGTFNMIHPDKLERSLGLKGLSNLAQASHYIGSNIITLCTGSRDTNNMWRFHPDNNSQQAWDDLLTTLEKALHIAEQHEIILGVEPELSNVINTAGKARDLLDTFPSEYLKIVMDAANLIPVHQMDEMYSILDEAFDLLGEDIVLAHAKDFSAQEDKFVAAGQGNLDFQYYLSLLKSVNYNGPLILHGLSEEQVPASRTFLEELIDHQWTQ